MSNSQDKTRTPVILITGKNGQVGWELQRSLLPLGKIVAVDIDELDLTKPDNIRSLIRNVQPNIIINPAAYTAVDKAENDTEAAYLVNATAPGVIAEEAKRLGALLVHYSTDYVFNGKKDTPYTETDTPDPINVYGASKLAGEKAIQESGCDYLIFRTSWVFSSRGQNFLLSMLRLAKERPELNIVADQIGTPTSARFIADATALILSKTNNIRSSTFKSDIYNLTSSGSTSWHNFSSLIIDTAYKIMPDRGLITKNIQPILTTEYPTPAKRPMNSRLSTRKIEEQFSLYIPTWQEQTQLCLGELVES